MTESTVTSSSRHNLAAEGDVLMTGRDDIAGFDDAQSHEWVSAAPAMPIWRISQWTVAEWFVVSQTLLPAVLLLPGTQALRFPIRVSSFVLSLGILGYMLLLRNISLPKHPARPWLIATVVYLAVMIGHPMTNSPTGGLAQVVLYLCVMSPLLWAPSVVRTPEHFRRLVILLLIMNGVNAVVGVLQVYDPDTWMPAEFSRIVTESRYGLGSVSYIGADGQRIIRPPGLFDSPGAVAGPGMFAGLLGAVFAASRIRVIYRLAAAGLALGGITAIYLSQVRTSLVLLVLMLLVYLLALIQQRRVASATAFGTLLVGLVLGGLSLAAVLGGNAVLNRVTTLFESDPFELYYASRGGQVAFAFNDVFNAPLGAGLGRWGMIAHYFFDPTNFDSPSVWVEIQIAGWLVDGGFVVLTTYAVALILTAAYEWRVTRRASDEWVRASGAVVLAANVGTTLLCMTFTPFLMAIGMQYWFLAGALFGVDEGQADATHDP